MLPRTAMLGRLGLAARRPRCVAAVRLPCAPSRQPRRTFLRAARRPSGRAVERFNVAELVRQHERYSAKYMAFLFAGMVSSLTLAAVLCRVLYLSRKTAPGVSADAAGRTMLLLDADGSELVPTGSDAVPTFPRTIRVPNTPDQPSSSSSGDAAATTEYTLVGLGMRTVSMLRLNVYIVAFYVATADLDALQAALIKIVSPVGTTLVAGEKDSLRWRLMSPDLSSIIWRGLLADRVPARSAFRIVPVRSTDFNHLRDGFARALMVRADTPPGTEPKVDLADSMRDFRALFSNRGKAARGTELLLVRDGHGDTRLYYDDETGTGRCLLGTVTDERIGTGLWLNYLGGRSVASEVARLSIVEGLMEFVQRPVGTVPAQVRPVVSVDDG